ncbi:hypothetical protein [Acetobacter okinawensis]|uniref:hypothetical protein n=1 Tax=Acetobacter okinawensis TaxID=1076594 RepID=UPI000ABDF651
MHDRFHIFFTTGTFGALLLATSALAAAPVAPAQQATTSKQAVNKTTAPKKPLAAPKTTTPIAGILDAPMVKP